MKQKIRSLYKLIGKRTLQFQEMVLRNSYVIGSPFELVLELGNLCNLKCPLCATPYREKKIPKGMLNFQDAKKILDQFPMLVYLIMPVWGEPFLNRDVFKISGYAQEKGIQVHIRTNLNVFNRDMAEQLIETVDDLMISLDGASPETYEKYRVKGDFNTVIRNIELIRELQISRNNFKTNMIWKMIVHRFNEHEVGKAEVWAEKLGIKFLPAEIYTPPRLAEEWKPKSLGKSRTIHTDNVKLCHSLWQSPVINFNGDVFPCCSEFSREDAVGNIFEKPFREIYNNDRYMFMRKRNRKNLDCKICHFDKETSWYKCWVE